MKVLCCGMIACDILITPVPEDILQRDSFGINQPVYSCGGDAMNVALALSKLGNAVSISGRIAGDPNGAFIQNQCRQHRINTNGLVFDPECATATSFALIDKYGERHFLTDKAIFAKYNASDVTDAQIMENEIVYFGSAMALPGMNESGISDLFSRAHRMGKVTAMDAAIDEKAQEKNWLAVLTPALMETDYFLPSFQEAALIAGTDDIDGIISVFSQFPMKGFGIKLGARGCVVTDFSRTAFINAVQGIKVADTTGAGDSFFGGFLTAIGKQWDLFNSAKFATAVSALNVEKVGGTAGVPDFEQAVQFYKNVFERREK